ncbi:MAG: hypothetical protein COA69_11780 [Robiginitomaculum sp.]|nr:MAG: hypothetical protein COA69_11780 [Robiginitomaculum sp.]
MNATPLTKINDRLMPFGSLDTSGATLSNLDVFHQSFSNANDMPLSAKDIEAQKIYEQGVEAGRVLATNEGALFAQGLQQKLLELGAQIEASHNRAVSSVLRAVLPHLAQEAVGMEISRFLGQIAGQALQGQITLRVSPAYEATVNEVAQSFEASAHDAPEFIIEVDENMAGTAVDAKWCSGGGSIDIDAAVQNCLALLTAAQSE